MLREGAASKLEMCFSYRYVQSGQSTEVPCYTFNSLPPAGLEEPNQVELLLMENERLRQELESHREKTGRIQKVREMVLDGTTHGKKKFYLL